MNPSPRLSSVSALPAGGSTAPAMAAACQPDGPRRRQLLPLPLLHWLSLNPVVAAARRNHPDAPALELALPAPPGLDPSLYLVSEKYDGARAFWDGHRLRFRSGLPVPAPESFVARLPPQPLDGELWLGRGRFEALSGLVRRASPDAWLWRELRYMVFDLPGADGPFAQRVLALRALADAWPERDAFTPVAQNRVADAAALQDWLARVVAAGGEGLVLHRADAPWQAGRSAAVLKLRPVQDAEAQVVGHLPGRGRHEGRLGALQVRDEHGRVFYIGGGLSDAERSDPPPRGAWVTYSYRGRTESGLPRFASFLRLREF